METETKKTETGMVDALDQATLNRAQQAIESLGDRYRVPKLAKVGPMDEGIISGLFSGNALKLPKDLSKGKQKRLRRLVHRLLERPTFMNANLYLHALHKKCLGQETAPRVLVPEREEKMIQARKAWRKAQAEAEKLRVAYRLEKGDYFKKAGPLQRAA